RIRNRSSHALELQVRRRQLTAYPLAPSAATYTTSRDTIKLAVAFILEHEFEGDGKSFPSHVSHLTVGEELLRCLPLGQ
ncbi:hypothetical protein BMJ19_21750, partial [Sinorhizobium medicae]